MLPIDQFNMGYGFVNCLDGQRLGPSWGRYRFPGPFQGFRIFLVLIEFKKYNVCYLSVDPLSLLLPLNTISGDSCDHFPMKIVLSGVRYSWVIQICDPLLSCLDCSLAPHGHLPWKSPLEFCQYWFSTLYWKGANIAAPYYGPPLPWKCLTIDFLPYILKKSMVEMFLYITIYFYHGMPTSACKWL